MEEVIEGPQELAELSSSSSGEIARKKKMSPVKPGHWNILQP